MIATPRISSALGHSIVALLALSFMWFVSQTAYVTTGIQFVAPLLVITLAHLLWMIFAGQLVSGFSHELHRRSALTACGLAAAVFLSNLLAPLPAQANAGELVGGLLMALFCLFVIVAVVALCSLLLMGIFRLLKRLLYRGRDTDDDSKLFDLGSALATIVILSIASLEGHPRAYSFTPAQSAEATQVIMASPEKVWQVMQTATDVKVPLPAILAAFPQPVAVTVDEGTALGAQREVHFSGREGSGAIRLEVTERTPTRAYFRILSDTTPYAAWVAHEGLSYQVEPHEGGTKLTVALEYERRLSPAWVFMPAIQAAARLGMNVLARDVKSRSEN